ncbi:MAG: lytic murein transglycosylase B [Succinivibrionaceae bacterium]|nr:lytic murein transglycosylase B [Ruminobacter sp.]MEE1340972.1 lytic murein transglycosylase B [Succinivibrionaceae bacterium]
MKTKSFILTLLLGIFSLNSYAVDNELNIPTKFEANQKLLKITKQIEQEKNPQVTKFEVIKAFNEAQLQESIIKAMNRPGEAKPWYEYRKIFIIPKRIEQGIKFYQENYKALTRASSYFNVPEEIIVSIIGVETMYGANMGRFRVLDALYTLGFYYPKREEYFQKEFINFIKLAKEQNWKYDDIKGSYAGAMGMGQFMPYSYLTWAVDFNNDHKINLFSDKEDVIGSIANYFKEHGYDKTKPTLLKLNLDKNTNFEKLDSLIVSGIDLTLTIKDIRNLGIMVDSTYSDQEPCKVIKLETENGYNYYLGLHNFRAIMTYNRSPLYAMAVYELSQIIKGHLNK